MSQPPLVPNAPEKRKGRGCLIGCLVAVLLIIVLVAAVSFFLYKTAGSAVESFTDDTPVQLPVTNFPDEDVAALEDRVDIFGTALENEGEAATLELTADELNAMINNLVEEVPLGEWIHVTIEDDVLGGEVSVPLDKIFPPGTPFIGGRYVNGAATFSVDIVNSRLQVFIESLEVKNTPVPREILNQLANENLAKDFNNNPEYQPFLQRLEDITIEDGRLIITLKAEE